MDYDKLYKLLGKYTDSFIRMKIPKKLTIREDLNKCVYIYYDSEEILEKKLCFQQIVINAIAHKEKRRDKLKQSRYKPKYHHRKLIQCGRFSIKM